RRVVLVVCLLLCPDLAAAGPVLVLPGGPEPSRLRLEVLVGGPSPPTARGGFLDRPLHWFGPGGDGALNAAEAGRLMPLPLPGGKVLPLDFARLDADGNGKVSREELKTFCRTNGFTPVVTVVDGPSADDLRLADLFQRRLDADGDGKV